MQIKKMICSVITSQLRESEAATLRAFALIDIEQMGLQPRFHVVVT